MTFLFGKPFSVLGFVLSSAVLFGGCGTPTCPAGSVGPYDNRDRTLAPHTDEDWVCLELPEAIAQPLPPDLGRGLKYPDPEGPKDQQAVAIAAIFIESCIHDLVGSSFNINERIDAMYSTMLPSHLDNAIAARLSCLTNSDYGYGCDRVRQCLGIVTLSDEPSFQEGCHEGTAMHRRVDPSGMTYNDWGFCNGIGLECQTYPFPHCGKYGTECAADEPSPSCDKNYPFICEYSAEKNKYFVKQTAPCLWYGLSCVVEADDAFCTGTGSTCASTYHAPGDYLLDFRSGIACDDNMTLRTCINGHEATRDCSKIAYGFECIGGSRPRCGAGFQCDYEGLHPLPTCEGTLLTVCNAGASKTFDCNKLGFRSCDPARGVCSNATVEPP